MSLFVGLRSIATNVKRLGFCGVYAQRTFHADHIKDFALFPNLRLDINNGRTLCKSCHRKTDNYGFKKSKKNNKI